LLSDIPLYTVYPIFRFTQYILTTCYFKCCAVRWHTCSSNPIQFHCSVFLRQNSQIRI